MPTIVGYIPLLNKASASSTRKYKLKKTKTNRQEDKEAAVGGAMKGKNDTELSIHLIY